jgi:hypothetical protein
MNFLSSVILSRKGLWKLASHASGWRFAQNNPRPEGTLEFPLSLAGRNNFI